MKSKHRRVEREGFFGRTENKDAEKPWDVKQWDTLLNYLFEVDSVHITVWNRYSDLNNGARTPRSYQRQAEQFCHDDHNNLLEKYEPKDRPWRKNEPIGAVDRYFVHTTWDSFVEQADPRPFPIEHIARKVVRRPEAQVLKILFTRRVKNQREWDQKMADYRKELGIE